MNEQVEVLSLIGDMALQDGKPKRMCTSLSANGDVSAHGRHLLQTYGRQRLKSF